MVAGAPFVRSVERTHRHPFVETARGDGVVELAVGLFRLSPVSHPCRHVLRIAWHVGLGRRRLPSIRRLRTHEFQTERRHPVPERLLALGQRQGVARRAIDHVQVAGRENAVRGRVLVADEGRDVREDAMRRHVGRADPPRRACRRVRLDIPRIHGDRDERAVVRLAARRHPGGRDGPDAADADVMLAEMADGRDRPEPFDLHPVGQLHDQGPAVEDGGPS